MGVRLPDSVEKICKQLGAVAQSPFTAYNTSYPAPLEVVLSRAFFRKYSCYPMCGGCCLNFSLDWTPAEYPTLEEKYPEVANRCKPRSIWVNGKEVIVFTIDQGKGLELFGKNWCSYLEMTNQTCNIHEWNPFSCQVELIKFRTIWREGVPRGYLLKGPFGRGWEMSRASDGQRGVICDFEQEFSPRQFEENDLPVLKRALHWANHLGIETHLPRILDWVLKQVEDRTFQELRIERKYG